VLEAARAINDAPIAPAFPELAQLIGQTGENDLLTYRVLNAHFRLGRPENAAALVRYVGRADAPARMRAEALTQLGRWSRPPARDRITGNYQPLPEATRSIEAVAIALRDLLPTLLTPTTPEELQLAALDTA